jgi:hypothetical protein
MPGDFRRPPPVGPLYVLGHWLAMGTRDLGGWRRLDVTSPQFRNGPMVDVHQMHETGPRTVVDATAFETATPA